MSAARAFLQFSAKLFWWCLVVGTLVTMLGTVSPLLAIHAWPCELASHFQVQYVVLLTLAAMLFAIARRIAWATVAIVAAWTATYMYLVPLYSPTAALIDHQVTATVSPLRIVSTNIAYFNRRKEMLIDFITQEQPDVVLLYEVSPAWLETLTALQATLPSHKMHPCEGHPGLAIFSRLPLDHVEICHVGEVPSPVALARLQMPGSDRALTIVAAHPHPPVSPSATRVRNDQLTRLIDLVNEQSRPLVLLGDLNTTSWNPAFTQLLRGTNLCDSRQGFGISPTWNAYLPPLRIPIDHCLVSDDVAILNRQVGSYIGSDHFPLVIDLVIP